MAPDAGTFSTWPAIRSRMVELEHEAFTWADVLRQYRGDGDPQKIHHAEYALAAAERELAELRTLLGQWEQDKVTPRIPLSMQFWIIAVAVYMAIMLVVVLYLVTLAQGE